MLFSHMSLWAIGLVMIFAFVLKYYAVEWILKTNYAQAQTQHQGWVGALITNAVLNGILDFVILFFFAGYVWAVGIAVVDTAFHYLLGYWKKRQHLPSVNEQNMLNVYNVVNFLHTNSYIGVVALVIKFLLPSSGAAQVLGALGAGGAAPLVHH